MIIRLIYYNYYFESYIHKIISRYDKDGQTLMSETGAIGLYDHRNLVESVDASRGVEPLL